jgi:hypothetical protein
VVLERHEKAAMQRMSHEQDLSVSINIERNNGMNDIDSDLSIAQDEAVVVINIAEHHPSELPR